MAQGRDDQEIQATAQAICDRIDGGLNWRVHAVRRSFSDFAEVGVGPEDSGDDDIRWGVYPLEDPLCEAVVRLASDLQDHAAYATWGQALPPCPGHTHPLNPIVVDGRAVWQCPASAQHHREPIV